MLRFLPVLIATTLLGADNQIQRMTQRLADEAAAFQKIAPQVVGRETLVQKAAKISTQRKFPLRIRVGDAPRAQAPLEWQSRTLVSEYGYTTFADGAMHELRQVVSVDGQPVKGKKGSQELARIITASNDKRKQELLKAFQEYGLLGAVNDFGQVILLFSPRGILRYEFVFQSFDNIGGFPVVVYDYHQIDGPNALTMVDARGDGARQVRMEGSVWVRQEDLLPLRVTVASTQSQNGRTVRHEATVNYSPSEYGPLLPVSMQHREMWDGEVVAQNEVRYEDFKRVAAVGEKPR